MARVISRGDLVLSGYVLQGNGLAKSYVLGSTTTKVVDNVDFRIAQTEICVLLGPSGTGKSTLLYILAGLLRPEKGQVLFGAKDIYALSDHRLSAIRAASFGFIFQSYNLVNSMTAQENVEIPLRLLGAKHPRQRATAALKQLGLQTKADHRPGQLSGGEQQRVAIARALVHNPQLIFADEPTGNLDETTGSEVIALLADVVREQGAACLLVTHNTKWTEIADRVVCLAQGKIEESSQR